MTECRLFLIKSCRMIMFFFMTQKIKHYHRFCAKGILAVFVSSQVALGALINHFMHEKRYSGHILTCLVTIPLFTGQKVYRTSNMGMCGVGMGVVVIK